MKKILLCVPLLAIFAAGFFGCSQQRQWNHEQRKAMREALRSYRQMVYLDDLNDAEFVLFSDEVAGQLENSYPVYMEFVQMQGVDDTSDMSQIRRLESQCANDLFSWVVTEVDVIETVPATPAATAQTPAAPKTAAGQQTPAAPAKK